MLKSGEIILAQIQFSDTFEIKKRPALVLYEEFNNIVVAGITSNLNMDGVLLSKKDGAIKKSVIKLNYVFTISKNMVYKKLFLLSEQKKYEVYIGLRSRLSNFNNKLNELVDEKLKKYFSITKEALDMVKGAFDVTRKEQAIDFYDMASRYYSDAQHFFKKGDYINAFAAVNYSHGWLDAGARIKLFNVNDNKLFTVD